MTKEISFYELELIHSIDKIEKYVGNMTYESFCEDDKTFDACCMQLQHIGECGIKMAKLTNNHYKDLPFSLMKGFRNRITHDYIGIDEEIVWAIIKKSLPELKKLLKL